MHAGSHAGYKKMYRASGVVSECNAHACLIKTQPILTIQSYILCSLNPTFAFWQKIAGINLTASVDYTTYVLSHIAHMHNQMDRNLGISLIPTFSQTVGLYLLL